jgi:hypothetical protein
MTTMLAVIEGLLAVVKASGSANTLTGWMIGKDAPLSRALDATAALSHPLI